MSTKSGNDTTRHVGQFFLFYTPVGTPLVREVPIEGVPTSVYNLIGIADRIDVIFLRTARVLEPNKRRSIKEITSAVGYHVNFDTNCKRFSQ